MIITHLTSQPELWNEMISPPILVSKGNVMIGYNPIYEYSALPDVERIVAALNRSIAAKPEREPVAAVGDRAQTIAGKVEPGSTTPATAAAAKTQMTARRAQSITVPIMGEGIRAAK